MQLNQGIERSKRMTSRNAVWLFAAILCLAFLVSAVSGRSVYDRYKSDDERQGEIQKYSFPQLYDTPVSDMVARERDTQSDRRSGGTQSLGSSGPSGAASPGLAYFQTSDDWQWSNKVDKIGFLQPPGIPSIQFVYTMNTSIIDETTQRYGTNYYNPWGGGDWPNGFGVGCQQILATDEHGYWADMSIDPEGHIIVAGVDDKGGSNDHHLYSNTAVHGCFFGGGSQIPYAQYSQGFFGPSEGDSANYMNGPDVDVQVFEGDTITHLVATEASLYIMDPSADAIADRVAQYFRKVNQGGITSLDTWEGPLTIDSLRYRPQIASSRVSGKVAVSYVHRTPLAYEMNNGRDTDVYYRFSDSAGALNTWSAPINITNFDRSQASRSPWLYTTLLYDSDDELHILWEGNPWPPDVYDSTDFFFGDFTTSMFHWSSRTGVNTRVANRDYGLEWNTQVCGFGGENTHYLAFFNLSECNGRLYTIYVGFHDVFAEPPVIDDCASSYGDAEDRRSQANGELYIQVSSSLDGILWDAPRNITQTYTPECDSAGFGGVCMNDTKVSVAPYGMDITAYDSALTWPGADLVQVDPGYAGNYFLHAMYVEDHFPGFYALGNGTGTNNDLKWMRIGCIDPITAAQIDYNPKSRGYPAYVNHGEADTVVIEVVNDGNTALEVNIDTAKVSPGGDWLGISKDTLYISEGINNTGSFEVYLNNDGLINSPGTVVALRGEVYMLSNAPDPRDSVSFLVEDFLIADTVVGLQFDTLYTTTTPASPPESVYVALVATSHGEYGYNGNSNNGGYNLDYTLFGGDCDENAGTYLYSGGPYVVQDTGGGYEFSAAVHNQGFVSRSAFKPVLDFALPASSSGPNYDKWFTGTFVNWDTSLAFEQELWAPTGGGDSTNFMIQMFRVFAADTAAHNNLALGSIIDWDIPSDEGSDNLTGISAGAKTVYIQGFDTTDVGCPGDTACDCQANMDRYGAQSFLGWYSNTVFNADNCANDNNFHGVFSELNDSLLFLADSVLGGVLWDKAGTNTGQNAYQGQEDDLHTVMTYLHNVNLGATDTLTFYTVLTTVHEGSDADIVSQVNTARQWWADNVRPGCPNLIGCCVGLTGNVDGDEADLVDVGDLTALIAYLYIPPNPEPVCFEEANVDGDSGGLVDVGDLTALIAYLYIPPNPEPATCQ
jgi:hypothetical protein